MNHNMRILFINMRLNFRLSLTDHILIGVFKNKTLSQVVLFHLSLFLMKGDLIK